MNRISSKFILSIISAASLLPKVALAYVSELKINRQASNADLAAQLIENKMFLVNQDTNEIIIDEAKLLKAVKLQIKAKLENQNSTLNEEQVYQDLIENLKPGNFERNTSGSSTLRSMDFNKGG